MKHLENQSGQSFVEFVLLLAVLASVSLLVIRSTNGTAVSIWSKYIQIIASPNEGEVQIE